MSKENFENIPQKENSKNQEIWIKENFEKGNLKIELELNDKSEIMEVEDWDAQLARETKFIKVKDKKSNKEIIINKDELSPGYRLMKDEDGDFCHMPIKKVIRFGDLKKNDSFLVLFHEIGHAQEASSRNEQRERLTSIGIQNIASDEDRITEVKKIAQSERKAWAFALKKIKQLRLNGIDLVHGVKDLSAWYDLMLKSYDLGYASATEGEFIFLRNDKEWKNELKKIYSDIGLSIEKQQEIKRQMRAI